ncbi:hypothetical protein TNCV_4885301, partial [Trichonephila clavipes]
MASTKEMKRSDQSLEDLMKRMGYLEFGLSLPRIENFPPNKNIVQQQQKKNSRHFRNRKLANAS